MKDLEYLKRRSLQHRMAMARIYQKPEQYLTPEEVELFHQEEEAYQRKFDDIDKSGPYRPVEIKGRWHVVGHGEITRPCANFEDALRLLISFESDLKQQSS